MRNILGDILLFIAALSIGALLAAVTVFFFGGTGKTPDHAPALAIPISLASILVFGALSYLVRPDPEGPQANG